MSGAHAKVTGDKQKTEDKMDNGGQDETSGTRSVAAVCLGLLCVTLLAVILALVAHNHSGISNWSQQKTRPIELENLTFAVMELQAKLHNCMEMKKEESNQTSPCSVGWIEVNRECLYISPKGVSKSWPDSKKDCEDRGGRLVTVKNQLKLQVLSRFYGDSWIGLSDRETENSWKWEDGTALGSDFWREGEPNDSGANEDCVHLRMEGDKIGFNDLNCDRALPYICETSG